VEKVIAVFDIGKTNKKIFLFNEKFQVVYQDATRFEEILDDDNDPCDDIEAIEKWIQDKVKMIQEKRTFTIKAINFSTHGATLVYLDKEGNRITPLYNYLKPLDDFDFTPLYTSQGGTEEFSRKTASPTYGMLNSGMQMYWLKNNKGHFWAQVDAIVHYPQYLSYLFSKKVTADFTSVGAHTALWDFDKMEYHPWLAQEHISLPIPTEGKEASISKVNGEKIAIGSGLHDSSSSIIPLLENNSESNGEFVLLSTGTWIICMNPFSREKLTQSQLKKDCLCFMTPEKKQVKSSMQFLGRVHEVNAMLISDYFNVGKSHFLKIGLKKQLCINIFKKSVNIFFPNDIPLDFKGNQNQLNKYNCYEGAYYQLIFEITHRVCQQIQSVLDKDNDLKDVYISGGFNRNEIFIEFLSLMMPGQNIKFPEGKNTSALGAALLMKGYLEC
jgi:sugar (pentulose or hexulose) kinase